MKTVTNKAHKPIIREWLETQLSSDYGKALLGAAVASLTPMAAPLLGKHGPIVERVSQELLTRSYTVGLVKSGADLLKLGKPLLSMLSMLFTRFEAEAAPFQITAQADRGGMEQIERETLKQAVR